MCDRSEQSRRLARAVVSLEYESGDSWLHMIVTLGPVAQWIERRNSTPKVAGSSPAGIAIQSDIYCKGNCCRAPHEHLTTGHDSKNLCWRPDEACLR